MNVRIIEEINGSWKQTFINSKLKLNYHIVNINQSDWIRNYLQ